MERVLLTICFLAIVTQPTQCSRDYDDDNNTQSIKTSCIDFMTKDTTFILDEIRSTATRMNNTSTDVDLTESMNKLLNDVNKYECFMSNGNSSGCDCSTSVPIHPDDLAIMTQLFNDPPLWHTTYFCHQVANTASNEKMSKLDQSAPVDIVIIRVIVCIITTICFPAKISPRPTVTPSVLDTEEPSYNCTKTLSPSRSTTPRPSVNTSMTPTRAPASSDVISCLKGLILSDRNNNTYIDRDEYLVFVRTQGCEDIFRMTTGIFKAFKRTCYFVNVPIQISEFSISSVYSYLPDDVPIVERICNITLQAIQQEVCTSTPDSSRPPSVSFVPNPVPVRITQLPSFVPRPRPVPVEPPIQPDPTLRPTEDKIPIAQSPTVVPTTPFLTDTPSFSKDTEECLQFFLKSNDNNDTRFTESEYLNFVSVRTNCRSLRTLPQQQAATLLSWCEEDFGVRSCKAKLEFAMDDKMTFNGRLNIICAPIVVNCPPPDKTDPILVIVPTSRPDSVPSMLRVSVPITSPDSVPITRPENDPTSLPESPNIQFVDPDTATPTNSPTLQLPECIDALAKADVNNDTRLDITEYTAFVVDSSLCPGISTLSESQLKVFEELSCKCQNLSNATTTCCLRRNARIDIAGVNSLTRNEMEIAELKDVCVKSQNALDNGCPESTLAPSTSPVVVNPVVEGPLAGNLLAPTASPTERQLVNSDSDQYVHCLLELVNSDSDHDRFLSESEYLQFLRLYGKCDVNVLSEQQTQTFFKFVDNSGSENRSIALESANPFGTAEEIEFLKSLCYLEKKCQPDEEINDCTDKLAMSDTDKNKELDETEFPTFIVDYLQCPPQSRLNISNSFADVLTALNTTMINISGAENAEYNRSTEQVAVLRSICSLAKEIKCQDGGDECTANMILADRNSDGKVGADEYLIFVNKRSKDCNGSDLPYLPLAHRATFQIASCLDCLLRAQIDVECCHPHHASITTDYFTLQESQRSELQQGIVRDVCISTRCVQTHYSAKNDGLHLTFPVLLLCAIIMLAMSCIRLYHVNDVY